jgi:hypothetical protein
MHKKTKKNIDSSTENKEFKIPVEKKLLTFVRTKRRSVQEFARDPNSKVSSANENNAVKKLQ